MVSSVAVTTVFIYFFQFALPSGFSPRMSLIFLPQTLNLESSIFTNLDKRFAIRKCHTCFVAVLISLTNDFSDSLRQLPFFYENKTTKTFTN